MGELESAEAVSHAGVGETVRGVGGLAPNQTESELSIEGLRREISEVEHDVWLRWVRLVNPR